MLQISTSVQQAAQVVALMQRVITSAVASRVPAIAAIAGTVQHAQVGHSCVIIHCVHDHVHVGEAQNVRHILTHYTAVL